MPIEISHITFRYGRHEIFGDYSAVIPDRALLWGSNGCGKTTLIKLIAGILRPMCGSILWEGHKAYRSSILLSSRMLYDDIPFEKQLSWICLESGQSHSWLKCRCEPFGLGELLSKSPAQMSQGMRQWASLAFVCAMPADLYLLDEPLQDLDPAHRELFYNIIKNRISDGDHIIVTGHAPDEYPDGIGLVSVSPCNS